MQVLEIPAIPKEKHKLQALINEARHRVVVHTWLWRAIWVMLAISLWRLVVLVQYLTAGSDPAALVMDVETVTTVTAAGHHLVVYLPLIAR